MRRRPTASSTRATRVAAGACGPRPRGVVRCGNGRTAPHHVGDGRARPRAGLSARYHFGPTSPRRAHHGVFDFPTVLSKFLMLGLSLEQVIARATATRRRRWRRSSELGTLARRRARGRGGVHASSVARSSSWTTSNAKRTGPEKLDAVRESVVSRASAWCVVAIFVIDLSHPRGEASDQDRTGRPRPQKGRRRVWNHALLPKTARDRGVHEEWLAANLRARPRGDVQLRQRRPSGCLRTKRPSVAEPQSLIGRPAAPCHDSVRSHRSTDDEDGLPSPGNSRPSARHWKSRRFGPNAW